MNHPFSKTEFLKELEFSLPSSSAAKRRIWATVIIERNIAVKDLSKLLTGDQKIATRFLWLLSEIGTFNPARLLKDLPYLLAMSDNLNPVYKTSFASFWHIVGVPPQDEGRAIDLLFQLLLSSDANVTTKSRSLLVLFKLTQKHPELKHELIICLEDQLDKHSADFNKRATKILTALQR